MIGGVERQTAGAFMFNDFIDLRDLVHEGESDNHIAKGSRDDLIRIVLVPQICMTNCRCAHQIFAHSTPL